MMDLYSKNDNPFKGNFKTLESLVDRISEVFHCPVTIEDANHRLLAYSQHNEESDQARIQTIIGRRVPEKVINSLWKNHILAKINRTDEPVRIAQIKEVGLGDRIAIAIRKNNEVLGYIWALEVERKLSDQSFPLFKQAAQAVKNQLLQLQGQQKEADEGVNEFFWKLLTGNVRSKKEIHEKFVEFQLLPPAFFSVVVFQFQEVISKENQQQIFYLLSTTQQLKVIFRVFDEKEVIMLTAPNEDKYTENDLKTFIREFITRMSNRFSINSITGGSGTISQDYTDIERSYQEALFVLQCQKKFPDLTAQLFNYRELGIYRYLDLILEKNRLEHYENHSLKKLKQYDLKHHSQLFHTLETYLNFDSNMNEAAKALHIHLNTLNYRLKRIAEIGEINLRDPHQKVTLFIDLKLERLQEKEHL
ncbi:transcriptional activator AdeR [Robertmurraya siralis]|uniref:Transcriptional activator AdeR n=1 Tax=Robertmurraya siralis TaxID=77777 RepID=A0A919WHG0_9BACI|nr:helix-turn-helix domain-containing protein [Robertmurraya siralis]GIN61868.1 transcriptional activator AdeR [Robertmurraya siralis]